MGKANQHVFRISNDYIMINTRLCRGCWKCIAVCPKGVLGKINVFFHKHVCMENPEKCIGCRACEKVCRGGAIQALKRDQI